MEAGQRPPDVRGGVPRSSSAATSTQARPTQADRGAQDLARRRSRTASTRRLLEATVYLSARAAGGRRADAATSCSSDEPDNAERARRAAQLLRARPAKIEAVHRQARSRARRSSPENRAAVEQLVELYAEQKRTAEAVARARRRPRGRRATTPTCSTTSPTCTRASGRSETTEQMLRAGRADRPEARRRRATTWATAGPTQGKNLDARRGADPRRRSRPSRTTSRSSTASAGCSTSAASSTRRGSSLEEADRRRRRCPTRSCSTTSATRSTASAAATRPPKQWKRSQRAHRRQRPAPTSATTSQQLRLDCSRSSSRSKPASPSASRRSSRSRRAGEELSAVSVSSQLLVADDSRQLATNH